MIDKRSSLYNITTSSNEVLLTLRILSTYPMFWIGMTIRLAALFFALPWMVDVWFLPFVSSYVGNWTLDPWSHFLNQGGDPVSYPYGPVMLFVYGTMFLIGLLSRLLHKDNIQRLMTNSLLSVVLWHVIVNFGVYFSGLGTQTLAQTYILAIPFDFRLLTSTLLFSSVFYGIRHLVKEYSYLANKRVS